MQVTGSKINPNAFNPIETFLRKNPINKFESFGSGKVRQLRLLGCHLYAYRMNFFNRYP